MSANRTGGKAFGPMHLGEVVGRAIRPAAARRGLAIADLVSAWPEIAGPAHAARTVPEKIVWPRRGKSGPSEPGTLVLRVAGPQAIFVQHEIPQIIERINAFFGYAVIQKVRLVQAPMAPPPAVDLAPTLSPTAKGRVVELVSGIDDDALRDALERLGRGVFARRRE